MKVIGAQGEITIIQIEEFPESISRVDVEPDKKGRYVISHSESGHHHVLTKAAEVFEDEYAPEGMKVLYALLDKPAALVQDAPTPHGSYDLPPGKYEFRLAREFDPFESLTRAVID